MSDWRYYDVNFGIDITSLLVFADMFVYPTPYMVNVPKADCYLHHPPGNHIIVSLSTSLIIFVVLLCVKNMARRRSDGNLPKAAIYKESLHIRLQQSLFLDLLKF